MRSVAVLVSISPYTSGTSVTLPWRVNVSSNIKKVAEETALMLDEIAANDTLYAEMVQDTARRQGKLEQGQLYVASISFSAMSWNVEQGLPRMYNQVILTKLVKL